MVSRVAPLRVRPVRADPPHQQRPLSGDGKHQTTARASNQSLAEALNRQSPRPLHYSNSAYGVATGSATPALADQSDNSGN